MFERLNGSEIFQVQLKVNADFFDIFSGVIDDIGHVDFVIRDKNDIVIFVEQNDFCQVDIQNFPFVGSNFDIVINIDFIGKTDDDTTDDRSHKLFGYDCQCCRHDRKTRQQPAHINTPESKQHSNNSESHNQVIDVVDPDDHVVRIFIGKFFAKTVDHDQQSRKNIDTYKKDQKIESTANDGKCFAQKSFIVENSLLNVQKDK